MMAMNLLHGLYMASLLATIFSSQLTSKVVHYKDMAMAPNAATAIDNIKNTPHVESCLIKCSKNKDCKSIVFEETTCSLYDTSVGSVPLTQGQKAIAEEWSQSKYGK